MRNAPAVAMDPTACHSSVVSPRNSDGLVTGSILPAGTDRPCPTEVDASLSASSGEGRPRGGRANAAGKRGHERARDNADGSPKPTATSIATAWMSKGPRRSATGAFLQVRDPLCGGQGRGRTADLPLFRRTLVPTELPAQPSGTGRQGHPETDLRKDTCARPGGHIGPPRRTGAGRAIDTAPGGGSRRLSRSRSTGPVLPLQLVLGSSCPGSSYPGRSRVVGPV